MPDSIMPSQVSVLNPFYNGKDSVPFDKFVGREDLSFLSAFEARLAAVGSADRFDEVWALVGRKSFGKSCIGRWCKDRVSSADGARVLVCSMRCDDLFASGRHTMKDFLSVTWKRIQIAFGESSCKKSQSWHVSWFFTNPRAGKLRRLVFSVLLGWTKAKAAKESSDLSTFFENLRNLCGLANPSISLVVLVFDEVRAGNKALAELLHQFSIEVHRGERWQPQDPSILVVYLPLPGWDKGVAEAKDRRIELLHLSFFSVTDIDRFLFRKQREASWRFDDGVSEKMFRLSGGQPYLFQRLGWQACQAVLSKGGEARLTCEALDEAAASDPIQRAVDEVVEHGFDLSRAALSASEVQVIGSILSGISEEDAFKGITRAEWLAGLSSIPLDDEDVEAVFERLWPRLTDCGVIRPVGDGSSRYRFSGELVRRGLVRISNQS